MPIDTSMYNANAGQNFVSSLGEGMRMGQLARTQEQEQALRDAFAKNVTQGPDGQMTVNQAGLLATPGADPSKLIQLHGSVLEANKRQLEMKRDQIANHIDNMSKLGQLSSGVKDQASYDQYLKNAAAAGLDTHGEPLQFDQGYHDNLIMASKSLKDQAEEHHKGITEQIELAKANAARAEAGLAPISIGDAGAAKGGKPGAQAGTSGGGYTFTPPPKMQAKAVEDFTNAVNGSRQQDDAKRALLNVQASQNLREIAKQATNGDLNSLNPQQTKLAMMEAIKMATGGVPAEGELQSMTPDGMAQKYASALQKWTNKSQPANAGEFIKQAIDYGNGIAKNSAQLLYDRSNEIADRHRKFLGEDNYKQIKGQVADEFSRNTPGTEVNIQLPDGRTGSVPKSNLSKALSKGAKVIP